MRCVTLSPPSWCTRPCRSGALADEGLAAAHRSLTAAGFPQPRSRDTSHLVARSSCSQHIAYLPRVCPSSSSGERNLPSATSAGSPSFTASSQGIPTTPRSLFRPTEPDNYPKLREAVFTWYLCLQTLSTLCLSIGFRYSFSGPSGNRARRSFGLIRGTAQTARLTNPFSRISSRAR